MAPRNSLLPSFLYDGVGGGGGGAPAVVAGAPSEPPFGMIELFSPAYYSACAFGGAAACGLTHAAVTPLDVIKCNIQVHMSYQLKKKSDRFALLNLTCPDIGKVSAKFYETEHLVNLATISVTEYLGHFDLIPKYALSNYWHSNSLLSNVWFSIKICQ